MENLKLGRLPRTFDPRVCHLSSLIGGAPLPAPPSWIDYTRGMSGDFGAMLNQELGCCTCSAVFHARQVWTFNATGHEVTEKDARVLELYEAACGYKVGDPSTDQGGNEQNVLKYLLNTGMPINLGGERDKILAFVEVDPRNIDDVKRTIDWCGVAYIGFDVPDYLMADGPPVTWVTKPGSHRSVGGHAVVLAGYDQDGAYVISWGRRYVMDWDFFQKYCDEVYAICDSSWIASTGKSPLGMTVAELEKQMEAIRN